MSQYDELATRVSHVTATADFDGGKDSGRVTYDQSAILSRQVEGVVLSLVGGYLRCVDSATRQPVSRKILAAEILPGELASKQIWVMLDGSVEMSDTDDVAIVWPIN
jgi:hypothetical protein